MKKVLFLLLAMFITCCLVVSCATVTENKRAVSSDVEYPHLSIDGDGFVSATYNRINSFLANHDGVLTIPSVLDGIEVRGIYAKGFSNLDWLVKVVLPDTCEIVGKQAFESCTSLKTVVLGANTYTIDEYAFAGCSALKTVTLGKNTAVISAYAFQECSKLSTFNIKSTEVKFCAYSFDGCTSLSLTIPKTGVEIEPYAFNGWTESQQIDICIDNSLKSGWNSGCNATIVKGGKYALSYNGNGNTSGETPSSIKYLSWGTEYEIPSCDLSREGYTFVGWVDLYGDSSVVYSPGDIIEIPQRTTAFMAKWEKI